MTINLALAIVATVAAAACSNNTATPNPTSPTSPGQTVTVTAVTVTGLAAISSDSQLTASARFSDSTARDVTTLASWTSSNDAYARVSSTGEVTVVGTGAVELRATYQGVVGVIRVEVSMPARTAFVLTGVVRDSSTNLPVGGVDVRVVGYAGGSVTTNQAGVYTLDDLASGRILVEFVKDGYEVAELGITLTGDEHQDVLLNPVAP